VIRKHLPHFFVQLLHTVCHKYLSVVHKMLTFAQIRLKQKEVEIKIMTLCYKVKEKKLNCSVLDQSHKFVGAHEKASSMSSRKTPISDKSSLNAKPAWWQKHVWARSRLCLATKFEMFVVI